MTSHLHAIVLAAGDGTRVRNLTTDANGVPVPKQFAVVDGSRTMLQSTLSRAALLVPRERLVVVVAERHRRWWERDLAGLSAGSVVAQPGNRGTAVGLLLPLLKVLQRDTEAQVLVLPSDHHVDHEATLNLGILEALRAVKARDRGVVLLGARPTEPDAEYGWIVPRGAGNGVRAVAMFTEKPDPETTRRLMERGALLNTLILVAAGRSLLHLYGTRLPRLVGELVAWRDEARDPVRELERLFAVLPAHDFSRDVLQHSCEALSVLPLGDCGWSDLGTPTRLRQHQQQHLPVTTAESVGALGRIMHEEVVTRRGDASPSRAHVALSDAGALVSALRSEERSRPRAPRSSAVADGRVARYDARTCSPP